MAEIKTKVVVDKLEAKVKLVEDKEDGMVHPRRPDGKVDYSSLVYCRCRGEKAGQLYSRPVPEEEPEHYVPVTPDMIDFPVSWDFHRHYCQYYGWPDPGPDRPAENTRVEDLEDRICNLEAISAEPGRMPRYYHDKLQQLEGRVLHAESKMNEHIDRSRRNKQDGRGQRILKGIET